VKTISARRLLKRKYLPTHFFVDKLLVPGLTVLAGKPKRGKSLLALSLAVAIAKGFAVFGELKTTKSGVLYLGLEDGWNRLQDRLRWMKRNTIPRRLDLGIHLNRLDMGGYEKLEKYLTDRPAYRIIIIDTLAQVRPPIRKPSLMYQEDTSLARKLRGIARKFKAAIIVVHHCSKKEFSGDVTSPVLGSTGFTAGADTVMLWDREHGCDQGILRVAGRDVEDAEWTLNCNVRKGKWRIISYGDSRDLSTTQATIFSVLKKANRLLGPQVIAQKGKLSYGSTRVILRKMKDAGLLKCINHKYSLVREQLTN